MSRLSELVLLIVGILSVVSAADSPAMTAEMRTAILAKHNSLRGGEGSTDIPAMVYDISLEASSRLWAAKCTYSHSSADGGNYPDCANNACGQDMGENLWMSSANTMDISVLEGGTQDWFDEKPDWTYGSGTYESSQCAAGKQCGHYTQVVSKMSLKLGCAYATGCDGQYKSYIVCQYSPGGNLVGATLFSKGTACSACGIGYNKCVDNLCVGAPPALPTGKYGWAMMCAGTATEYELGACVTAPSGASWAFHKGSIVVSGRKWVMQITTCANSDCSSGCANMSPQELAICGTAIGFDNKFTYLGTDTLPEAPGTMTSESGGSTPAAAPTPAYTASGPAAAPEPAPSGGSTPAAAPTPASDQATAPEPTPSPAAGQSVDGTAKVSVSAACVLLLINAAFN